MSSYDSEHGLESAITRIYISVCASVLHACAVVDAKLIGHRVGGGVR